MGKTTANIEIKVSNARITNAEVLENGTCMLTVETEIDQRSELTKDDDIFVLIEASKLSLKDGFMQYKPKTDEQKEFKKLLTEAIQRGVKDFYRPKLDPSFVNSKYHDICYSAGNKPAVGKSYNWWNKKAKAFCPERNSRLGTKIEYIVFLGVLIKRLVDEGWKVADAWNAVCNDSKDLGHYCNSENSKHEFEDTGSREICGFFDLANTYKILAKDEEAGGFWLAGGDFDLFSYFYPLADLSLSDSQNGDSYYGVGWLVLEK